MTFIAKLCASPISIRLDRRVLCVRRLPSNEIVPHLTNDAIEEVAAVVADWIDSII